MTISVSTSQVENDESTASRDPDNLARWRSSLDTNYRTLIREAQAAGHEVIVVGRASLRPHKKDKRAAGDYEVFRSLADLGVPLLDTQALFHQSEGKNLAGLFSRDRNHYSAAGKRRIADALAELMIERLAVTAPCRNARRHEPKVPAN